MPERWHGACGRREVRGLGCLWCRGECRQGYIGAWGVCGVGMSVVER